MAAATKEEKLKKLIARAQDGKAFIGKESVMKALRGNKVKTVFLAKNCPTVLKADIQHHAALAKVSVIEIDHTNEEIGVLCKKNFFISVAGIAEE